MAYSALPCDGAYMLLEMIVHDESADIRIKVFLNR